MGLKPNFNIDILLKEGLQYNKDFAVKLFNRIGMGAVRDARLRGNYGDITGNLRNSVGYLVAVDGVIVNSIFDDPDAISYSLRVLEKFPEEIVLIVFAGMEYASYVQSKGYDVLASVEVDARKEINKLFENL